MSEAVLGVVLGFIFGFIACISIVSNSIEVFVTGDELKSNLIENSEKYYTIHEITEIEWHKLKIESKEK